MISIFSLTWNRLIDWFKFTVDNILHSCSNDEQEVDCFWWLDVTLLLGGIKQTRWTREHYIRHITNFVYAFQGIVYFLQLYNSLRERKELTETVWHAEKFATWSVAGLNALMISLLQEPIIEVRKFINSNGVNSDDEDFDKLEQRKFNRSAGRMLRIALGWLLGITVLLCMPNPAMETAMALPPQLLGFGQIPSKIMRWVAVNLLFLGLQARYVTSLGTIGTLLLGMRLKFRLVAHRYTRLLIQPVLNAECYLENMDPAIKGALQHHLEYWRYLNQLKSLVAKLFVIVHYFAISSIGGFFFVAQMFGINLFSIGTSLVPAFILLEYFFICRLVDTFKDEADKTSYAIFELCSRIPYSSMYHSEYVQIRSSLMIVCNNTRSGVSVNCFRLFEISTFAFIDLVKVAYSVSAFLIRIGYH